MDVVKFMLNPLKVHDYLIQILKDGKTLSEHLLKRLTKTKIKIAYTFLPSSTSKREVYNFTSGGKFPVDLNKVIYKVDNEGNFIRIMDPVPFPKSIFLSHFRTLI